MQFSIYIENPRQPEIVSLLSDGEAFGASLYPAESNHFLPLDALGAPNVLFFVARDQHRAAVGTAALVVHHKWAELKRMWVAEGARGKGVSKLLLAEIEKRAPSHGVQTIRLETGINNTASLALYERSGFRICGPFADYRSDPWSVFMEKQLSQT